MSYNIKIGNTTFNGVNKIKCKNADDETQYVEFGSGGLPGGYNVTLSVDGSAWQLISVTAGSSITSITSPSITGKAFLGWSTTSGGSVNITFPYTPTGDVTLYAVSTTWSCTVAGLGSSSPSSVTFTHSGTMPTFEEVTFNGDIFIKLPKMYRKINTDSSSQITGYTISTAKVDSTYSVYPCFLKEDGTTEIDYVLMGKYCSSSTTAANSVNAAGTTTTIGNARTLCQARGTGYQQMDWMIFKLWQDLLTCKMNTIDTNPGTGIQTDALGVTWYQGTSYTYPWVDGVARNASAKWVFCNKPTSYADSPTSSTTNYIQASYSTPTISSTASGYCISKLGYDTSNPFFNYPSASTSNTSYNTYYCDGFYGSTDGNYAVSSYVGLTRAYSGAFLCSTDYGWSDTYGFRLCYRPLA